jgi:DNA-binding NtrC family response regulator
MITTPSLREQLADSPQELKNLVLFIAQRVAGDEADAVAEDVIAWIEQKIGTGYTWPGNIRELEQCVRNVMIRREYHPGRDAAADGDVRAWLSAAFLAGDTTADELLRRYCTIIYAQTGSYEAAARRLQLDRRTVKAKVDQVLLREVLGTADAADR